MQTITEAHAALIRSLQTTKPDAIRNGRASIPDVYARADHVRTVANIMANYLNAASQDLKDNCPEYQPVRALEGCLTDVVAEHLCDRMHLAIETIRDEFEAEGEDPDTRGRLRREAA